MDNIYIHNKTGNKYQLVQEHLLCKTIIKSEQIYGADSFDVEFKDSYDWDRNLDKQIVLYKALYESKDGPFFVRYAKDFFKNFTKVEPEKKITKPISEYTAEQIYYFENGAKPSWDEWVKAGIELEYGKCEDDFDYYDYQFCRGDFDYTRQ